MLEKRTVIDQIEIRPDGVIQVRLAKQIVDDGVVIASEWHRTVVEPGVSVVAQMQLVNTQLTAQYKLPACNDFSMLTKHAAVAHTPDVVSRFQAAKQQALEALKGTKP